MKFAVSLSADDTFYRYNPCGAEKFSIYTVHTNPNGLTYALLKTVKNPWCDIEGAMCSPEMRYGECALDMKQDLEHIVDHYAILEVLSRCTYLLGDNFCDNTKRAMHNAGIKTYNVPPFISMIDKIITHFLIGVNIADSAEHIHYAS